MIQSSFIQELKNKGWFLTSKYKDSDCEAVTFHHYPTKIYLTVLSDKIRLYKRKDYTPEEGLIMINLFLGKCPDIETFDTIFNLIK